MCSHCFFKRSHVQHELEKAKSRLKEVGEEAGVDTCSFP